MSIMIAFFVTLGLVIMIHELGHFLVCKWTGIYVKTFSIGFGPKLLRWRFGETEYALSAVPFGGYVKMAGEGVMEEIQDAGTGEQYHYPIGTAEGNELAAARDDAIPEHRHFRARPPWQRLAVVVAGPLANLLLAFVIFSGSVLDTGLMVVPTTSVGYVRNGSPAEAAGLQVGDRIVSVAGRPVANWSDVTDAVVETASVGGEGPAPVPLRVERDGRVLDVDLRPGLDDGVWNVGLEPGDTRVGLVQRGGPAEVAGLRSGDRIVALDGVSVHSFGSIARIVSRSPGRGIGLTWERDGRLMNALVMPEAVEVLPDSSVGRLNFERYFDSQKVSPGRAVVLGWRATWSTVMGIVGSLPVIFESGMDAVGGPIRVGQVAGEMLRWSFGHLMQFVAFFSVNLFLLNLLPVPVLDGGHVVFILYEMIVGRSVHQRVQAIATQVGLIMLMLFMITVIVKDVLRVIPS